MLIPLNPYVAGNPVGGDTAFVGRKDVLREVKRVINNPQENSIVLYGQRRIGKTSILQQLDEQLSSEDNYRPVYFDLQDKAAWQLEEVLLALAREISHSIGLPDPSRLDFGQDDAFRNQFLPQVLEKLATNCFLVLLFDEFDVLDNPSQNQAGKVFFPYLRELMLAYQKQIHFVFVIGRKPEDLDVLTLSVFKGVKAKRVSLLNQNDTRYLINLSQENGSLNWQPEAVGEIWQLTHGHPYLTQLLCQIIWNNAYDEDPEDAPTVTQADVQAAIPETIESSVNALEWLWSGLAPAERMVASVLAQAGYKPINQTELEQLLVENGVRIVISQLQNAPDLLQEWDLIEPVDGGYLFSVELLRQWISQKKPVQTVQQELDHIEPLAENLYQAGQSFYQQGQLETANDLLQRSLDINPNHLQAGLLIAQTFIEQGELSEAISQLEIIYTLNPVAARPRLVQSLLKQAENNKIENEKLKIYDRILVLIPNQIEAIEKRKEIWLRRGKNAYEREDFTEALEAFIEAEVSDRVKEVKEIIRNQEFVKLYDKFKTLEAAKQYHDALELIKALMIDFQDYRNGEQDKERIEKKLNLSEVYTNVLIYLEQKNKSKALENLLKIISLEPDYEDSLILILNLVKNIDVFSLQRQIQSKQDAEDIYIKKIKNLNFEVKELKHTLDELEIAATETEELESQYEYLLQGVNYEVDKLEERSASFKQLGSFKQKIQNELKIEEYHLSSLEQETRISKLEREESESFLKSAAMSNYKLQVEIEEELESKNNRVFLLKKQREISRSKINKLETILGKIKNILTKENHQIINMKSGRTLNDQVNNFLPLFLFLLLSIIYFSLL